jgi:hypothetical protein
MSSFNAIIADANTSATNTSATNTSVTNPVDEIYEFQVDLLPEFMTESSMFIMTMDMCPGSTTFPFLKSKVPTTLKIRSTEDFQRLTEADHMFGFTTKTQILILESMYDFWLNDPNSSELPLPVKDFSHFGNQVIALFTETNNILPVRCFQCNYVELFNYLLKRDGLHKLDSGRWPDYTLPYYGAVCNHIEITRRGLEVGVAVAKDCIDQAIKENNQEMFDLFISYKVKYSVRTLEIAAEKGLPEMYKHFLKVAIDKKLLDKFVLKTLENKVNLEFLLHRSGIDLCALGINGEELLEECLKNVYNLEIFQMVDAYFTKPDHMSNGKTLINKVVESRQVFRYIPEKVIYKDDYELFVYLQGKGLLINEFLILSAIDTYKSNRLTPGFLKRKYSEQQAAAQAIAEREEFERQID